MEPFIAQLSGLKRPGKEGKGQPAKKGRRRLWKKESRGGEKAKAGA
jgi:hypothetical protein